MMRFKVTIHGYGGYTNGCRCDVCTSAKAKYMRERRASARASTALLVEGITHGTQFGYEEKGCRCLPCTDASNKAHRESDGRRNGRRCTACRHPYGSAEHETACRSAA